MATNEDINVKIKVDATQAEKGTSNYKQRLKDLKDEMINLQMETNGLSNATEEQRKRFAQLEAEAGQIADTMGDVGQRIKTVSNDYANFNAALEGLKGGAAVAQGLVGTLDLLGVENAGVENVVKTLMSLQGVMNSINAVQQIFNKDSKIRIALQKLMTTTTATQTAATGAATVAQRALNAAMNAMPILAIVSAAALLITALTKISKKNKEVADSTDQATDSQKKFFDALNALNWKYTDIEAAAKQYIDIVNSTTATDERKAAAVKELNNLLGVEGITAKNVNKAWQDYSNGVLSAQKNLDSLIERQKKEKEEGINDINTTKAIAGAKVILSEKQNQLKEAYKATTKTAKESGEKEKEYWDKNLNAAKYANKEIIKVVGTRYRYETDELETALKEQSRIRENYLAGQLATLTEGSRQWKETSLELLREQQAAELESLSTSYGEQQISFELFQSEKYRIEQEYREKEKELTTTAANYEIEQNKKVLEAKEKNIATFQQLLTANSSLVNSMMAAELEAVGDNQEQQKKVRKKYATAQAIMNISQIGIETAKGIMGAWSAYAEIPFVGTALAAALSVLIGATGAAQTVAAIREKNNIQKAARGAYVTGASHSAGGVLMELEGGEMVLNKRVSQIPQYRSLASQMNVSTGGVPLGGAGGYVGGLVSRSEIKEIVTETVAGVTSIPVIVSENSISEAQRKVRVTNRRATI